MKLEKFKNELLFLPLGGSGEIGMNLNLYQYKGKWIIVDLGAGFADDYLPGVDMIVPDINFLYKIKDDILGLILTHAHEDHLGAVQYLWDEIHCPIYTTGFTATFLKSKLAEMSFAKDVLINEVVIGGTINLDPFTIELVPLTHSAPEMQALVIRTDLGNVLHTGDWKFDHDPLIGAPNDEKMLSKYGDEGILALIGDSTNVFNASPSGSEGDLRTSLVELIKGCEKMVAVTTFASNVARIETIIHAAAESGRRVVLAGKSLWRITQAAQESGYLKNIAPFLSESEIKNFPREKLLILCTGCQGELLAATNKIANNAHPYIKFSPEDTIIFSSKIIPGNEKRIFKLFNIFVKQNVNVMTEKDHFVHVSGHPSRGELEKMYKLVRPKIAIPVHGELVHIHEHAKLALRVGVPKAITVENGDIIRLAPDPGKVMSVEAGYLAIDGNSLISPNSEVMKTRRKLQKEGIVIMTLLFNQKNSLIHHPIINAPGLLGIIDDKDIFDEITEEIVKALKIFTASNSKVKKSSNEAIINLTRSVVRRIIKKQLGKNPSIEINIEKVW